MIDQDRLVQLRRALEQDLAAGGAGDRWPAAYVKELVDLEVERWRGLLARLEWPETLPGAGPWHICPICSNHRDQGHEPDCWLAKELGR